MADHKIVLTLTDDMHTVPSSSHTIAHVGDTLRFDTNPPNLPFRVEIPGGSLFEKVPSLVINDRRPRVLAAEGKFFWKCFVQRPSDKKFVGWSGEDPQAGGDVDVRP